MRQRPSVAALARKIWNHPGNRGHRLRALARAAAWQIGKRATGKSWDLTTPGGLTLRCHPDSTCASSFLYFSGRPEYHEMAFVEAYLRPGDGFLDVGANIGMYTLLACAAAPGGAVDAFEPSAREASRLRENLALNGLSDARIRVHEQAAAAAAGPGRLAPGLDDQTKRLASPAETGGGGIGVECVRLDDAVGGNRYALGKIDVEGSERFVLAGAQRMLADANPPVWLVEMNGLLHDYGVTEEAFASWMAERGYDIAIYDADTRRLLFGGCPWRSRDNVLFVARAKRAEVSALVSGALSG